jgi:predicted MPP superfamily phosphohydrolase
LKANVKKPLRILLLSDLHLESEPSRREKFLHGLRDLKPDLVFLTGDVLQLDVTEAPRLRSLLAELQPALGHFACLGMDNDRTITAAGITVLENRSVLIDWDGGKIGICGLLPVTGRSEAYKAISGAAVKIVLNHTPDLADEAAERGADLYLCGHTHGGQVRIPFWGAIITNSNSGKKYEAGLYRNGETYIYTSRGFGLEPRPAPQVRFFCRPQATLFVLSGL